MHGQSPAGPNETGGKAYSPKTKDPSSGRACPGGSHPSGRQTGTSRCPPAFHRLCPSPLRVLHVCVVSCVLSDRGWGSIPQRLWRDGSPSWSVSGRCPPRRGLRVLALQVRSSRPAVPFIPSCPCPLARTPGGYLAVVAPCRDGLDAGSVLGHHLVRAARGGAHLRARVVNKNQTDRPAGNPGMVAAQRSQHAISDAAVRCTRAW